MRGFAYFLLFLFCLFIGYVLMNVFFAVVYAVVKVLIVLFIAALVFVAVVALLRR